MSLIAATEWPQNVLARYLTVANAVVEVRYDSGDLNATCSGERCPWQSSRSTEAYFNDTAEERERKISEVLPGLQMETQGHAEKCRAMPKPSVNARPTTEK